MFGDAQSTPEGGNAEVEKMNAAGVRGDRRRLCSSICLAATQTAARYDLPYIVDVGVADSIVTRGLKNTFRFGPGFGVIAKTAIDNLITLNDAAGKPAKTVMIVHEDSAVRLGPRQAAQHAAAGKGLPGDRDDPASDADARLQQRRDEDRAAEPGPRDPGELLQRIRPARPHHAAAEGAAEGIYSVLGGAASSYKFVKEFPEAAQYIMDCNHWFDPKNPKALELKKKVEAKGEFFTYEVYMNYSACCCSPTRWSAPRAPTAPRSSRRWRASTFSGHVMPYGPTKFVNGQNQGAAPVNTQVLGNDIQVIFPAAFASAKPVFPMPA